MFEYITDCDLYDEAITVLQNLYKNVPNKVFAHHLLATAKQQPEETLDEFYLKLQKLARDCNFRQVTSEQYRQEMVHVTLINSLSSNGICQRLLENHTLTLKMQLKKLIKWNLPKKTLNSTCSIKNIDLI